MKNQLIKLALFGLLTNELYADSSMIQDGGWDVDKDGKRDKVYGEVYYLSFDNKKMYDKIVEPSINGYPIIQKYRNKQISQNKEYTVTINGKKMIFIMKKFDKVDAKGFLVKDQRWDHSVDPLPKNAKGFKIRIVPNGTSSMYDLYVNYINGKFYITKMSESSSHGGCKHILAQKFPLPKIIDIDTFYELMLKKKNTKQCIDSSHYDEKGFNKKLFNEIYDIR